MRLIFVAREDVDLSNQADLILILGSKKFRVCKHYMLSISNVFRTLLDGPFAEAQRTIIRLSEDLDPLAMEVILEAAHGTPEEEIILKEGVYTFEFLERLVKLCDYYHCAYLLPEKYKDLLETRTELMWLNDRRNYVPSLVVAYKLGWVDEVRKLFPMVLRAMDVQGNLFDEENPEYEVVTRGLDEFPEPLLNALVAARKTVLKNFISACTSRHRLLKNDMMNSPICAKHPKAACVREKMGTFICRFIDVGINNRKMDTKNARMSIAQLMGRLKATLGKKRLDKCPLEEKWHGQTLEKFWRTMIAPPVLIDAVKRNSGL